MTHVKKLTTDFLVRSSNGDFFDILIGPWSKLCEHHYDLLLSKKNLLIKILFFAFHKTSKNELKNFLASIRKI